MVRRARRGDVESVFMGCMAVSIVLLVGGIVFNGESHRELAALKAEAIELGVGEFYNDHAGVKRFRLIKPTTAPAKTSGKE